MSAFKNALIQLNTSVGFTYTDLEEQATALEAKAIEFDSLAEFKDEGCACICLTQYEGAPIYTVPTVYFYALAGTITFGSSLRGTNTLEITFAYAFPSTDTPPVDFYYRVDGGTPVLCTSPVTISGPTPNTDSLSGVAESFVGISGLTPNTDYTLEVAPHTSSGFGTWQPHNFTTHSSGGGGSSDGTIYFDTPSIGRTSFTQPFHYAGDSAIGFTAKINGSSIGAVSNPITRLGLTPNQAYLIEVAPVFSGGIGGYQATTITTLIADASPETTVTFGTPTTSYATISQSFSYAGSDALAFVGRVDGTPLGYVTSPIELSGLEEGTSYEIAVAVSTASGLGDFEPTVVTTVAVTEVPQGTIEYGTVEYLSSTAWNIPFTYIGDDTYGLYFKATVEEVYATGGVADTPLSYTGVVILNDVIVTSPIMLTGLTPSTRAYVTTLTPYNTIGAGTPV